MKRPLIFTISGVKHSGKTTLITKLTREFQRRGLQTAVIKHDGHEFLPESADNDTGRQYAAGAIGTVIFSDSQYKLVKRRKAPMPWDFYPAFPEADIILLEGFKHSYFPKLEVIREGHSETPVCMGYRLYGLATDLEEERALKLITDFSCSGSVSHGSGQVKEAERYLPDLLDLNRPDLIADWILKVCCRLPALVLLAGGRSSRMGRDKAGLMLGEKTFLEHQIQKARELGIRELLVSGYHGPEQLVPEDACVIPDQDPGRGPLGGMLTAFSRVESSSCLLLPVDVPMVPTWILADLCMYACKQPKLPVILSAHGRKEPLIGIYPTDLLPVIREELLHGRGSVMAVLEKNGYRELDVSKNAEVLANINEPDQYRLISGQMF